MTREKGNYLWSEDNFGKMRELEESAGILYHEGPHSLRR